MKNPFDLPGIRFSIVFSIILSIFAALPTVVSTSHDPSALSTAERLRHIELPMEIFGHGHSHNLGLEDERSIGHLHGHNATDHSHETHNLPPDAFIPLVHIPQIWYPTSLYPIYPERNFILERPPKLTFSS
ncbi:hypothetical protein [uncultured Castellaniella sp.]|uniref:hypothetical protein n=1 Tax=uncultured Castellaniella sp. TaxID=647907 RepID=UPI0026340FA7|nr:hypothetical protein [uncultured Castellaniella sp.]